MERLSTWIDFLAQTEDDAAVIALANEFLNRLGSREVALLPLGCRPRELRDAVDLNSYALDLMRCHTENAETVTLVQRMMAFLFECAQRLAQSSWRQRAGLSGNAASGRQAA